MENSTGKKTEVALTSGRSNGQRVVTLKDVLMWRRAKGLEIQNNAHEYITDKDGIGHLVLINSVAFPLGPNGRWEISIIVCCQENTVVNALAAPVAKTVTCFSCSQSML